MVGYQGEVWNTVKSFTRNRPLRAVLALVSLAVLAAVSACQAPDELADRSPRLAAEPEGQATERKVLPVLPPERDLEGIMARGLFDPLVTPGGTARAVVSSEAPTDSVPFGPPPVIPAMPPGPAAAGSNDAGQAAGEGEGALGDIAACTIGVTGVVHDDAGFRLLIRHNPDGRTQWIGIGEQAFGYTIEFVTLRGAVVSKDGRYYVLPIGANVSGGSKPDASGAEGAEPGKEGGAEESGANATDDDTRFHGTWKGSLGGGQFTMSITFNADKTARGEMMGQSDSFSWSVSGATLHTTGGRQGSQDLSFRFENGDSTLVLSSAQLPVEIRLEKQ